MTPIIPTTVTTTTPIVSWRIIPLTTNNAAMNMAIDEAISEAVAAGSSPPTIRFYQWSPSAVSIGYFQSLHQEVDAGVAVSKSIDIVRRRTGGGAVYHDTNGEITYSVIAPESMFPKDIIQSYHVICSCIISSLARLNITATFHPINDILVGGRKISGNAQTRRSGILLQHGTILYDLDLDTMFSVLKVGQEKVSDKLIKDVRQRVTRLLDHGAFTKEDLYHALVAGFTDGKQWGEGVMALQEIQRARQLVHEKYSTKEWNGRR
ncbi:lipoate--protein ligase family protein [Candidatus Woesearchaeota archaeon]|nr:lipoate--protein ligase family protein [Candidatus Woesearchaeota archaeon]